MSNEIRLMTEMTEANPYNGMKLLFCVIISLLVLFNYLKKKNFLIFLKYGLICGTNKVVIRQRILVTATLCIRPGTHFVSFQ